MRRGDSGRALWHALPMEPNEPVDPHAEATSAETSEEEAAVRQHSRRAGFWPVALVPEGGAPREVVAVDLSSGGLFVRDATDLPAGVRIELRLALAHTEVAVEAVVRWVRHQTVTSDTPAGAGLAFVGLDEEARAALARELGQAG